eukprot:SAG25_NODE_859_length_5037_cov_2.778655_4_plen_135_part_00
MQAAGDSLPEPLGGDRRAKVRARPLRRSAVAAAPSPAAGSLGQPWADADDRGSSLVPSMVQELRRWSPGGSAGVGLSRSVATGEHTLPLGDYPAQEPPRPSRWKLVQLASKGGILRAVDNADETSTFVRTCVLV